MNVNGAEFVDLCCVRAAGTPGVDIGILTVADNHDHGRASDKSCAASENVDGDEVSSDEIDDEYYESMFYKTKGRCNHVIISKMQRSRSGCGGDNDDDDDDDK